MHPFINTATEAIEQAGLFVCKAMLRPDRFRVEDKGVNYPVSQIENMVESSIAEILNEAYPTHTLIGEEGGKIHSGDGDFTWLIDPISGTMNYLNGIPHFAISLACRSESHLEHGLIIDPLKRELFTASRGQGALLNRKRISISGRTTLKSSLIACGLPHAGRSGEQDLLIRFARDAGRYSRGLRQLGSSALDLAYTAAGRFDLVFDSGLKDWGLAAGALLIKEAGGLVTSHDGSDNFLITGNIIAGTPKCQRKVLPRIKALMSTLVKPAS